MIHTKAMRSTDSVVMPDPIQHIPAAVYYPVLLALLAALVLVAHWPALQSTTLDTGGLQSAAPKMPLSDLKWTGLGRLFTSSINGVYSPPYWLTVFIDQAIAGEDPFQYHLTNWVLHLLNVLLLLLVLTRITRNRFFSFSAALLFGVLTANTEPVAWIAARKDLLLTMFSLLSLRCFVRFLEVEDWRLRSMNYMLSVLSATAAFSCKIGAVALPLLLMAYHVAFGAANTPLGRQLRKVLRRIHYYIPFFVLGVLFAVRHFFSAQAEGLLEKHATQSLWERVSGTAFIWLDYLKAVFDPSELSPWHPSSVAPDTVAGWWLGASLGVAATLLLWLLFRYSRILFFGLAWFLIAISPYCNLLPSTVTKADRYIYLGSIGLCLSCAYVITYLWVQPKWSGFMRTIAVGLLAGLCCYWAASTRAYARAWRDQEALWLRVLERYDNEGHPHFKLAMYYKKAGRLEDARRQLEETLRFGNSREMALEASVELVETLRAKHFFQQAVNAATKVLGTWRAGDEESPQIVAAWIRLHFESGRCLAAQQQVDPAAEHFTRAAELGEHLRDATLEARLLKPVYYEHGKLLHEVGRLEGAVRWLSAAVDADLRDRELPASAILLEPLVDDFLRIEQPLQAADRLQKWIAQGLRTPEAFYALGRVYLKLEESGKAVQELKRALALQPGGEFRLRVAALLLGAQHEREAESVIQEGFSDPAFIAVGNEFLYSHYVRRSEELLKETQANEAAAIQYLKRAVGLGLADVRAFSALCALYRAQADYVSATSIGYEWVQRMPRDASARALLADLYEDWGLQLEEQGAYSEALQKYKLSMEYVQDDFLREELEKTIANLELTAVSSRVDELIEEVRVILRQALEGPDGEKESKLLNALMLLDDAEKLRPDDALVAFYRGVVLLESGVAGKALESLSRSVRLVKNPADFPDPLFWAGKAASVLEREEEARDFFSQYLDYTQEAGEHASETALYLYDLGKTFRARGEYESAANCFDRILFLTKRDTDYLSLHFLLGETSLRIRDVDVARRHLLLYQEATQYKGDYSIECQDLLAQADETINRAREFYEKAQAALDDAAPALAVEEMDRALELMPYHIPYLMALGELHAQQGAWEKALAQYEKVYQRDPMSKEVLPAYFHAGRAFMQLKDYKRAWDHLNLYVNRTQDGDALREEAIRLINELVKKIEEGR